ncbi:hypothetical protein Tco_1098188 [Tanacetum coccineum]
MAEQDIPPPTITAMKIPIIRKGEYDIWSMRMRQYICHTDHNLWDVIVNGDLEEEPAPTGETYAPPAPKTAKQLALKRNQERVKSILLLAIFPQTNAQEYYMQSNSNTFTREGYFGVATWERREWDDHNELGDPLFIQDIDPSSLPIPPM